MTQTLTTAELASATYATSDHAGVHLNARAFLRTPAGQALLKELRSVVRSPPKSNGKKPMAMPGK